ncbi:MAG: DNA polymerase IV [Planctomycetota bacterium]
MILHVDMDAFYASIEQRDRPELLGRPVVVGGNHGRGVVTAASYEARKFGIHSAMPGRTAARLCPSAVFVRGRMERYVEVGRAVREIFLRYTPIVQPLSLDEAFLDVEGVRRLHGDAESIGRAIKRTIREELDLPASVGIAPLKFVAKIASDFDKPNGFVVVPQDRLRSFLDPLPVERLWGVGRVGRERLHRLGFHKVADLRQHSQDALHRQLGEWGDHLWRQANAIDPRRVVPDHNAKGMGHERTFSEDLTDRDTLRAVVSYLGEQVARRLRRSHRLATTVTVKYRRSDFKTLQRTQTLRPATNSTMEVIQTAHGLLDELRRKHPQPVRLLGVSVGELVDGDSPRQMSLFQTRPSDDVEQLAVDELCDQVSDRWDQNRLHRGSSHAYLQRHKRPQAGS